MGQGDLLFTPQARGYVSKQGKALKAEPLGRVLTAFLTAYFPRYVDYGFTAGMEAQLDDVSGAARRHSRAACRTMSNLCEPAELLPRLSMACCECIRVMTLAWDLHVLMSC